MISPKTAYLLKHLLSEAVGEGTGKGAKLDDSKGGSAGKTGGAQNGRTKTNGESEINAWFVGYFPTSCPEYIVSVFVEDTRSGALDAAPIFRKIAEEILNNP